MEQSKALTRLLEAADLAGMLEELTGAGNASKLSPASMAGLKVTLRNIREAILASHDTLASQLVTQSRKAQERGTEATEMAASRAPMSRDLRTTIEKFVDK